MLFLRMNNNEASFNGPISNAKCVPRLTLCCLCADERSSKQFAHEERLTREENRRLQRRLQQEVTTVLG